jgi:hypothetical protein
VQTILLLTAHCESQVQSLVEESALAGCPLQVARLHQCPTMLEVFWRAGRVGYGLDGKP